MSLSRLDVWAPLPPNVYVRRPARNLPFPLEEPGCMLFERGRHALWHGLTQAGLRQGEQVLVPAYHHGSEIEALARSGLGCRFYDTTEDLAPDEAELDQLLTPDTRALYVIHYLGFAQDVVRWRRWCDQRGLLLIEDAAQAWLASRDGRPLGSVGDLAIFCLYKTFGLPDGGALVSAASPQAVGRSKAGLGGLARRHASWLAQRSPQFRALASKLEREEPFSKRAEFALGDPASQASATTLFLLRRLNQEAAEARRFNYELLLEELGDLVPPPFDVLPAGASPFAFPIVAARKISLLQRLASQGVNALDFWSVPHDALPADRFPGAAARRERLVALPTHQELTSADVERVARAVRPPPRRVDRVRLEPLESLERLQDEWSALATSSRNIFATWEWVSTWRRHFGGDRPLLAFACRSPAGNLIAILPLYFWASSPLRVLRFLGHGPSDELGPICAPPDRRTAAKLLRRLLTEQRLSWDVFVGEQLLGDQQWARLLGGRPLRREGNPVIRCSGGWEDYLASRSANLRQQVRRRERTLEHHHELRYRLADDPARLRADLDTLFALHAARWSPRDSQFAATDQAFHREFAARALERGWLRLWILELDGQPRAAWYGFRFEGVESYYQAGRDREWDGSAVGNVLLAHSIRAALDDGIREYRLLRGDEPFKYRLADEDAHLETVGVAHGARGAAGLRAAVVARRALAAEQRLRGR